MEFTPSDIKSIFSILDVDSKIAMLHVCREYRQLLKDEILVDTTEFDWIGSKLNDIIQSDYISYETLNLLFKSRRLTFDQVFRMRPIVIFMIGCATQSSHLVRMVLPVVKYPNRMAYPILEVFPLTCGYNHAISDGVVSSDIATMIRSHLLGDNVYWQFWEHRMIRDHFSVQD